MAGEATTATDRRSQAQVSKAIFLSLATTTDAVTESSLALHNDLDRDMLEMHACHCFDHQ